jgi:hypothetical protein
MSTIQLQLPDSLYRSVERLAKKENIPVDQLITLAVAEKIAVLMAEEEVALRGLRGDREKFHQAMAKVARVEPPEEDRL